MSTHDPVRFVAKNMRVDLRLITATVNDPLMAAVNAYTVKALAAGGTANTTIVTSSTLPSKL